MSWLQDGETAAKVMIFGKWAKMAVHFCNCPGFMMIAVKIFIRK